MLIIWLYSKYILVKQEPPLMSLATLITKDLIEAQLIHTSHINMI